MSIYTPLIEYFDSRRQSRCKRLTASSTLSDTWVISLQGSRRRKTRSHYNLTKRYWLCLSTYPKEGSCRLELIKFDDHRGRDTFWYQSSRYRNSCNFLRGGGWISPPLPFHAFLEPYLIRVKAILGPFPSISNYFQPFLAIFGQFWPFWRFLGFITSKLYFRWTNGRKGLDEVSNCSPQL